MISGSDLDHALADLAAAGITMADPRWVRHALERRRALRHVPTEIRRRLPHRSRRPRHDTAAVAAALAARGGDLPLRIVFEAPPEPPPPDAGEVLGAAALPRALLVTDPLLATLLRAHDLHLEAAAPILAARRGASPGVAAPQAVSSEEASPEVASPSLAPPVAAPEDVSPAVASPAAALADAAPLPAWLLDGLARAGDAARVLVLHDCDAPSLAALAGLRDRLGLPPKARLVTVGLRPAHVQRLRLPSERGPRPAAETIAAATDAAKLRAAEARWLAAGLRAEAAAVPPDRLLRALRRLLLGVPAPPGRRLLPPKAAGFV